MKFKIKIKMIDTGKVYIEEYDKDTNDAELWAKETIENFNNTLKPNESPREFISVEIISDSNDNLHEWDKNITGMSAEFRGSIVDIMYCKKCGITGKRFGISRIIKIDSKYKKKCFKNCDTSKEEISLNPERYLS